jgi:DNA polymerase-1
MVHAVDEQRSRCNEGEWQNGVRALAREHCRDASLLPPKQLLKLADGDHYQRERQARLHADYLAWVHAKYSRELAADKKSSGLYRIIDLPLVPVIREMENQGVGCDLNTALKLATRLRTEKSALVDRLRSFAPTPDDIFSEDRLRALLFDTHGFTPKYLTSRKQPSVSRNALLALKDARLDDVIEVRRLHMLLQHLRLLTDRRLHPRYHIAGSVSGRVYSRSPNIVGLPKDLRHLVVPRPGHVLVILDYQTMEMRILAALTKDRLLVNLIRDGVDLHRATAAAIYEIDISAVSKEQRNKTGKKVNFAIIYGQTYLGLSEELGISYGEANNMLVVHKQQHPGIHAWRNRTLEEARNSGGLLRTWIVGRRRCLPSINNSSSIYAEEAERKLINHQVQSLAADIVKIRLRRIADAVRGTAWPVLFAHDEVVLECPREHAKAVMAKAVAIAEKPIGAFCVPLKVDAAIGKSWADKP